MDFKDQLISLEGEWIQEEQPDGCEVNRIRGVKYMEIYLKGKGKAAAAGGIIKLG